MYNKTKNYSSFENAVSILDHSRVREIINTDEGRLVSILPITHTCPPQHQ
jgi:hypothetical protein